MSDGRCLMCDTCDVWCQTSDLMTCNRHLTSDVGCIMSYVRCNRSEVWCQTTDVYCLYEVWCLLSEVRRLMFVVRYMMSVCDVWCQMSHIFFLMKAALPKRRRFICNYQRLTYHLPTFNTHKRYARIPFICIQWQWPCSETNGQSIGSGKLQRKFSRTGKTDPGMLLLKNQFHNSVDC